MPGMGGAVGGVGSGSSVGWFCGGAVVCGAGGGGESTSGATSRDGRSGAAGSGGSAGDCGYRVGNGGFGVGACGSDAAGHTDGYAMEMDSVVASTG